MPADLHSIRSTLASLQANGAVSALIDPLVQLVEEVERQAAVIDRHDQWIATRPTPVADTTAALIAGLRKENAELQKNVARQAELLADAQASTRNVESITVEAIAAHLDEQYNRWQDEWRRTGHTRAGNDASTRASAWSDAATAVRSMRWRP